MPIAPEDIKISADPASNSSCKFAVDRPINPERSYYFPSPEKAAGSPLAERLFALDGVTSVLVSHDSVTVNKSTTVDWRAVGRDFGNAIREHVVSGKPAVAEELYDALPSEEEIREKVQTLLDREINPAVASHGGVIGLVDVKKNVIVIQMGGGCQGCGMANVTLKQGVEKTIRERVPDVGEILDATDHAAGKNPYYS